MAEYIEAFMYKGLKGHKTSSKKYRVFEVNFLSSDSFLHETILSVTRTRLVITHRQSGGQNIIYNKMPLH